jgi:hypothetical protein
LGLLEWKKHRVDLIDSPLELRRTGYSNAKCKLGQERRVNMIAFLSGVVVGLIIGALVGFTIAVLAIVPGSASGI